MKRRIRKIVNFFAFNLLFFALYLNFIHKDNVATAVVTDTNTNNSTNAAAFSGTVLVENPDQYLKKNEVAMPAVQQTTTTVETKTEQPASQPLKLSIN